MIFKGYYTTQDGEIYDLIVSGYDVYQLGEEKAVEYKKELLDKFTKFLPSVREVSIEFEDEPGTFVESDIDTLKEVVELAGNEEIEKLLKYGCIEYDFYSDGLKEGCLYVTTKK